MLPPYLYEDSAKTSKNLLKLLFMCVLGPLRRERTPRIPGKSELVTMSQIGRCPSQVLSTGGHATSLCVQHCSFPVFLEATESIKQCRLFCAARALRMFACLPCIEAVTVRLEGGGA